MNQNQLNKILETLTVRFVRLCKDATIPKYSFEGDAGLDIIATSRVDYQEFIEYGTGIAIEIPIGYVGLIYPRSSISDYCLMLANSVGIIDSGYRGEIKIRFNIFMNDIRMKGNNTQLFSDRIAYKVGDKIAQLIIIPYPKVKLFESKKLSDTIRNSGGFGSSGK